MYPLPLFSPLWWWYLFSCCRRSWMCYHIKALQQPTANFSMVHGAPSQSVRDTGIGLWKKNNSKLWTMKKLRGHELCVTLPLSLRPCPDFVYKISELRRKYEHSRVQNRKQFAKWRKGSPALGLDSCLDYISIPLYLWTR